MAHEGSGTAHKVISVILRLTEFCSAIIVLGILSRFAYYIEFAGAGATVDGRIIYTLVVAGISILYSMFFCVPLTFLFMSFPFDLILWIMWLVAFSLLASRTSSGTCSSRWYYNYWGYYWGRYWRVGPVGTVNINGVGCSQWRTALAFSFISSFVHLMSGILGAYVFQTYVHVKESINDAKRHARKLSTSHHKKEANGSPPVATVVAEVEPSPV